jgi:hypothetical protein
MLPFNVSPADLETWPQGELLFDSARRGAEQEWIHHPEYQDSSELVCRDGVMQFNVRANTDDEWAYVYLDPVKYDWKDYVWQTRFRRMTPFQEYAFNFRYVDFDNRYRYRFEDDLLFFDSKIRGKWKAHARMPFPMALGAWYDLRIEARGDRFRCFVNGMKLMENRNSAIPSGSISIILWEIDKQTDCVADIGPMTVHRLTRG